MARRQLRLLLWKDYLIRRRKLITLAGVVWATLVMSSLYIVRVNVENEDYPTCQFPARALPSAGLVTFMQSFICSVSNECRPMGDYQEIPVYENSRLTHIQRQVSPLIYNETVLGVAGAVPDALKLLGTISRAADESTFLDISKNGLLVKDLFRNPARAARRVATALALPDNVTAAVMMSEISFQGVLKGHTDRCNPESLNETIRIQDKLVLTALVERVCLMSSEELQAFLMSLVMEVDFSKYIKMLGTMYSQLNGDTRLASLGDTLTAVLRMSNLQSFVPPELVTLLTGVRDDQFSYYNLTIITKLLDLYEPIFGNTDSYKSIRGFADAAVSGVQWFYRLFSRDNSSTVDQVTGLVLGRVDSDFHGNLVDELANEIGGIDGSNALDEVFEVLPKISNFIMRWLPKGTKHEVLFYSTLLTKLIQGAHQVVTKNLNMEETVYNVTLRNPEAVKVMMKMPVAMVGKAFDALTDAERTQVMTSKVQSPNQMFCDVYRLQAFFAVTKAEAEALRKQLCVEEWKKYVTDLITAFGIYDVKANINAMASLVIQETLGKDIKDQLYTLEQSFQSLKLFIQSLMDLGSRPVKTYDWGKIINVTDESELMQMLKSKAMLGKQVMITVHGALAKEVVKQNPILDIKISPILMDATTLVTALNRQLRITPKDLLNNFKKIYPDVVKTLLATFLDEDKTYKLLSTHTVDMFCTGADNASKFLKLPSDLNIDEFVTTLCSMTEEIEKGLQPTSVIGKTVRTLFNTSHPPLSDVNWTKLITGLRDLYTVLREDYTYLFEFSTFNMDKGTRVEVQGLLEKVEGFWFGRGHVTRSIQLSITTIFRLLDLLDRDIFDLDGQLWSQFKLGLNSANGLLVICDEVVKLISAILNDEEEVVTTLPTSTVVALKKILPNIPELIVDAVNLVKDDKTDVDQVITLMNADPPWPCSASISSILNISSEAAAAVTGLETLMCLGGIQEEWMEYGAAQQVRMVMSIDKSSQAATQYEPHLFLKFANNFNSLIKDTSVLKVDLEEVFSDNSTDAEEVTFLGAWKYTLDTFNNSDADQVLTAFMMKIDTVLEATNTSSIPEGAPLNTLWEEYWGCTNGSRAQVGQELQRGRCGPLGRATWKHTLKFVSVVFDNAAEDLTTYFREINEPNANLIQMMGFTRSTGLYILYDKLTDFVGVLLNSYWDFGFMNQIRRASKSPFWDCEAVVAALVPAAGAGVSRAELLRVQPFVCPSLLYWVSLPRGENSLMDLVSKPQYFFYSLPVKNLTSSYEDAYESVVELYDIIENVTERNITNILNSTDIDLNTVQKRFGNIVDKVLDWKVEVSDASYKLFAEVNKKQFLSSIYLTRIVSIINKLQQAIDKFKISELAETEGDERNKLESELSIIQKKFKRRPAEAMSLHFDLITDVIWENKDNYTMKNAINSMCDDLKNKVTVDSILTDDNRFIIQICAKKYDLIYGAVEDVVAADYEVARQSLQRLVEMIRRDAEVTDVFMFFNTRPEMTNALKTSIKYSDDLGIPIYLKYLHTSLNHYNVILNFLTGEDWWKTLRDLYGGPYAKVFFDTMEMGLDIADDVINNIDQIHLVRLLRDINLNDTDSFCLSNVTLSDYVPDRTGLLAPLKQQACDADPDDLVKELPLMVIVSQGYDNSLELSKEINYTTLNLDIESVENKLDLIRNGPKQPMTPSWIKKERVEDLRKHAKKLLSKEMLTKISFGLLSNVVDASTLFLNRSHCQVCSHLTSWFKQLTLQLYKKQEYDALLCHLDAMTLGDVHHALTNDFHWDMAIKELISTRNYTKYELNKSINDFLEQVRLHLLEDLATPPRLGDCLAKNVSRNSWGNATLFVSVLAHSLKLLRASAPHLHEVQGVTSVSFLRQLAEDVVPKIHVMKSLASLVGDVGVQGWDGASVDLVELKANPDDLEKWLKLASGDFNSFCEANNCTKLAANISRRIDEKWTNAELRTLQAASFWRLDFVSSILTRVESILGHGSRILGVASRVDLVGALEGRLEPALDLMLQLLQEETMRTVWFSVQGIAEDLQPLLQGTALELDLDAVVAGLQTLAGFREYLIEEVDLKVKVSELFSKPDRLEHELEALGVNHTNFWSVAAPRIYEGHIDLKPLLTQKQEEYHISRFVCEPTWLLQVLQPGGLTALVAAEDVAAAVGEQLCGLEDVRAKAVAAALLPAANISFVFDKVFHAVLTRVYSAANLSSDEGAAVMDKYPQMLSLLPSIQGNLGNLSASLAKEPLFEALKGFKSVGGLLSSSEFLSSAGNMLCGKPFKGNNNRFYKAIAETKDFSNEPDLMQLDALPTDFCRALYRDVLSMGGGKIIWSFVKPLLMGRILYTPQTPAVARIVAAANASFAHMSRLTDMVHNFAASFPAVEQLSTHRAGLQALRSFISRPGVGEILGGVGDDVDVEGIFEEFGDLDGVGNLLRKASSLLRCVSLDRFHGVADEARLTNEAVRLTRVNEFSAGLVFQSVNETGGRPVHVDYKIRMDIDTVPTTSRLKNQFWTPGPQANFLEDMRYFRGFVQIQDLVDSAVIQLNAKSRSKREVGEEEPPAVYTQQMPYPCYKKDYFQSSLYESQALIVAFFFAMVFSVCSAIRFIVAEKESGNTMLMSIMGVNLSSHTLSWFVASLLERAVTCCCCCAVLCGAVLPRTDPSLLLAVMMSFAVAELMFCYMVSKLFRSGSLAAVCGGLGYLLTFMPFVIILSLDAVLTAAHRVITCLSMSTAFCYSLLHIARYEAIGVGAQWGDLWRSDDGVSSLGATMMAVWVDAALYLAVGWTIDRFFGPHTLKSRITSSATSSEKAGVSVVNVSKVYSSRTALHQLSLELQQGQVTALLGHNGAGKTTLIKIITGMLKPTSGHVVIRSEGSDPRLGVCPQSDVLFDNLTAAEHLRLYAQLKSGGTLEELKEEIDNILSVLNLGAQAHVQASRLSGGLRRRLCVALAFVAKPRLVLLDEPSSGVDPVARRDIWSLIVRLKEDRTVLLTTHHLDEAELLSDQIVILHKGQVHTTGSPVEIKRSLGNGYRLFLLYHSRPSEEEAREALNAVKRVVSNAQIAEMSGVSVEMTLPFFDADGLNNDFLQLSLMLESNLSTLGVASFGLDCSSLEQVMANICSQDDAPAVDYGTVSSSCSGGTASKSVSSSSTKGSLAPLVAGDGALRGSSWQQLRALMYKRYKHYSRNRWLLFLLLILPSLFVSIAMGFSMIRPPADNEVALRLTPDLYAGSTLFQVPKPTTYQDLDPTQAEDILRILRETKSSSNWTEKDNPACHCTPLRQECNYTGYREELPELMLLPDVGTLNQWLVGSQEAYIEKRYMGHSAALTTNKTTLTAWYNNEGHHALPAALGALGGARAQRVGARLVAHTHPLKISHEQLSKSTLLQHVADAGISGMLLLAYSLVPAAAAGWLVRERAAGEARLRALCAVPPAVNVAHVVLWDALIMVINIAITVCVLLAFGFPVFVWRDNLPAICLLLLLFGLSCNALVQLASRVFSEPSLGTMLLFCGNVFAGVSGLAVLLILDIISESEATDNARWTLHKIFMLSPQFALGDGLLEIAKNTVQAQVLSRFGMDTYKSPLHSGLIAHHYAALVLTFLLFTAANLAIECGLLDSFVARCSRKVPFHQVELEPKDVAEERRRVEAAARDVRPLMLRTIGNINAGYLTTESDKAPETPTTPGDLGRDVAQCVALGKTYSSGNHALKTLTLGLQAGQCTALLGENGAGKSTTFSLLTGELRPTRGQLRLLDAPAGRDKLCSGLISYCPQTDALDPLLTVEETLYFYCQLRGIAEYKEVIKRTVDMFDLPRYRSVRAGRLSGGNKRKLCAAVAFMGRAPLVLLDEPTSGMDPGSRGCVSRGAAAARAAGRAVLLSTHALDDAARLADKVAVLGGGTLRAIGATSECLERFGGGYIAQCRVSGGRTRSVWRELRVRLPAAALRALHQTQIQVFVPLKAEVDQKQLRTKLSDILRALALMQSSCDLDDYTVSRSSLDQMFLSLADRPSVEDQLDVDLDPAPASDPAPALAPGFVAPRIDRDELDSVTSL